MPGRKYNSTNYRYGFNGKEKDDDGEFGSITNYDYGFRIYNPGIGKFLSVDPLTAQFPWYTPYQFAGNMPILAIDLDGAEPDPRWEVEEGKGYAVHVVVNDKQTTAASKRLAKEGIHLGLNIIKPIPEGGSIMKIEKQYFYNSRWGAENIESSLLGDWPGSLLGKPTVAVELPRASSPLLSSETRFDIPYNVVLPPKKTGPIVEEEIEEEEEIPGAEIPGAEIPGDDGQEERKSKTEALHGPANMCWHCYMGIYTTHFRAGINRMTQRLIDLGGVITLKPDGGIRWPGDTWEDNHTTFNRETYLEKIERRFDLIRQAILRAGGGMINPDQIKLEPGDPNGDNLDVEHSYEEEKENNDEGG